MTVCSFALDVCFAKSHYEVREGGIVFLDLMLDKPMLFPYNMLVRYDNSTQNGELTTYIIIDR